MGEALIFWQSKGLVQEDYWRKYISWCTKQWLIIGILCWAMPVLSCLPISLLLYIPKRASPRICLVLHGNAPASSWEYTPSEEIYVYLLKRASSRTCLVLHGNAPASSWEYIPRGHIEIPISLLYCPRGLYNPLLYCPGGLYNLPYIAQGGYIILSYIAQGGYIISPILPRGAI